MAVSREFSFAREAEAYPDDRATILSFITKNINKTRKRREKDTRGRRKKMKKKKETEYKIYSLERLCVDYYGILASVAAPGRRNGKKRRERRSSRVFCSGVSPRLENTPREARRAAVLSRNLIGGEEKQNAKK